MANFIAHFAIQAEDLERARRFYERAFGWRFEAWGPPGYFKIHTGAEAVAGVTEGGLWDLQGNCEFLCLGGCRGSENNKGGPKPRRG